MFPSSYSYSQNANLSKTPQEHYYPPSSSPSTNHLNSPHYNITVEDRTIYNELLQQENMIIFNDHSIHNINNIDHDDGFNKPNINATIKKRSSNDRHSKIITAQGPRDRRMRLSYDVAKRFFKLQDMLGFDKASNTVEWLLMKSEPNIQELLIQKGVSNIASSTSQYELMSENIEDGQSPKSFSSSNHKVKRKASSGLRKSSYLFRPFAKETREMARKRARERTTVKSTRLGFVTSAGDDQFSKYRPCLEQANHDQQANHFGPLIINPSEQPSTQFQIKQGMMGGNNYSLMTNNWNPSFLFNNNQPSGVLPQEHDIQMFANLWEGSI
ncbi:uncharacterized protein [Rutidosis leptorrhynchoides]|uniref:uncharacterized protein n=1 Tax=Rutidosis leptorrhynchoides TaxID=125765 RepID=UPI003A993435